MSKAQFGLGFHKGKIEATEESLAWERQLTIGEIDYVLCGLSVVLSDLTQKINMDEHENYSDVTALAKAIALLNGQKMQLKRQHQDRVDALATRT